MIASAVVCPHPPLLLRELCGTTDAVPELRATCQAVLQPELEAGVTSVVVVGGAESTREWDPAAPAGLLGFGPSGTSGGGHLPLSLEVGRRLLAGAGWRGPLHLRSVRWEADREEVEAAAHTVLGHVGLASHLASAGGGRVLLLVLGDGGARRGDKAPGYVDPRAFAFDDQVRAALDRGDAVALRRLDRERAADLMVSGRAAFSTLGAVVLAGALVPTAEVLYSGDPHGVQYLVARWRFPGS